MITDDDRSACHVTRDVTSCCCCWLLTGLVMRRLALFQMTILTSPW